MESEQQREARESLEVVASAERQSRAHPHARFAYFAGSTVVHAAAVVLLALASVPLGLGVLVLLVGGKTLERVLQHRTGVRFLQGAHSANPDLDIVYSIVLSGLVLGALAAGLHGVAPWVAVVLGIATAASTIAWAVLHERTRGRLASA